MTPLVATQVGSSNLQNPPPQQDKIFARKLIRWPGRGIFGAARYVSCLPPQKSVGFSKTSWLRSSAFVQKYNMPPSLQKKEGRHRKQKRAAKSRTTFHGAAYSGGLSFLAFSGKKSCSWVMRLEETINAAPIHPSLPHRSPSST